MLTSLTLALGFVLAAPAAPPEGCDLEAASAGVKDLAPDLGEPTVSYEEGVLQVQFADEGGRAVAFLAVQLAEGRLSTASSAPRLREEKRELLNNLGPRMTGNQGVLRVLTQCPPGSGNVGDSVRAWEGAFRTGQPAQDGSSQREPQHERRAAPNPEQDAPPLPGDEGRILRGPPERVTRESPTTTLFFGLAGALFALFVLFWRGRKAD